MLFVGIDWSDEALDYHLRTADGAVLAVGTVVPSMQGLADLFVAFERHATPDQIGIAVETVHGAWIQPLLDRGYRVYPANPKTVDSFRKALSAAGEKTDTIDAKVLAMFLSTFWRDNRCLQPDDPAIVGLRIACQDRLRLVEERTAKSNELQAILKVYYPAFLPLFGDHTSTIALEFLQEFPTQDQMRSLKGRSLRAWLSRHSYSKPGRIDEMVALLTHPVLPVAQHLQQAKVPLIRYLAGSLIELKNHIGVREQQITRDFGQLPESQWAQSLPGAGPTLGPALLAIFGRDPNRFESVAEARALMGTAPVTKASGKTRLVRFRMSCWKFARRTLQLFADHSRAKCGWAEQFYQQQRATGHNHHSALRALAHKWVKIILALVRTGQAYNEAIYVRSCRRYVLKKPLLQQNPKLRARPA